MSASSADSLANLSAELIRAIEARRTVATVTILAGPGIGAKLLLWPDGRSLGSLGSPGLDEAARQAALAAFQSRSSERITLTHEATEYDLFVDLYIPPPVLIIIGAVHIAIPLVTFARELGFYTIVLDARSAFATPERFGHANRLIVRWPANALQEIGIDAGTYIVALTHDEKIDVPVLDLAIRSPAAYIGALGSLKTHARRVAALQELGATEAQIARIHAPIGLNINARRPEEIAVSIIAEIITVRNQGSPATT